jgi:hypothetical protein
LERGKNARFIGTSACRGFQIAKSRAGKFFGRGAVQATAAHVARGGSRRQLRTKPIEVTVIFFLL